MSLIFFFMLRRPPATTPVSSSTASVVYKGRVLYQTGKFQRHEGWGKPWNANLSRKGNEFSTRDDIRRKQNPHAFLP